MSYEAQAAAVWYERFCEHWEDLSDEPPPPLGDIAGDDIGEWPEAIALGYYEEAIARPTLGWWPSYDEHDGGDS